MGNETSSRNGESKDSLVFGQTSQGIEIHATLLRLTRNLAVFEVYHPTMILRTSEVLNDFKIVLRDRTVYSGRAVVHNVVNTGLVMVCEVTLNESAWTDVVAFPTDTFGKNRLSDEFKEFVSGWQKFYRVAQDYKVVVADLQTFLTDLRLWLEQVEMGIRSSPAANRIELEREIAHGLRDPVVPAINALFQRFEEVSEKIEEELRPVHRAFGKRQLHPLLLCSPFIYRTFAKPLGYAGDYEMMNMIIRNDFEGSSLFAKLVNSHILDQAPAHAVRNRAVYLSGRIAEETSRVTKRGRVASIYNVACGPAREVETFMAHHTLSDQAQFRLLDFNEETLRHAGERMDEAKRKYHRTTEIKLVRNSVQSILKGNGRPAPGEPGYDLIYCSGLYDYLNDRVCKALNTHFYDQLQPGGALIIGNFATCNPIKNLMEHFLEWFLIYRDARQLKELAPDHAPAENCQVIAEPTSTNIFLEVRKPG